MPEMNKPVANIGSSSFNPFSSMSNKFGGRGGSGVLHTVVQHNLNKDLVTHEYGLASGLSAQEHQQRVKENAANNRHEIRKVALEHNNNLEVKAVDHNNSLEHLRTESGLRVGEENARSNNALAQLNTGHQNATEWLNKLHEAAAPGTEINLSHGEIKANFTSKPQAAIKPEAPTASAEPTAPTANKPTVARGPGGRMVSLKKNP